MNRQFIFRHYWWIALLAVFIGIGIVFQATDSDRTSLVGSIVAGALAFCYFVQTQKHSEISLFKELFMEFNRRYDGMNDQLIEIANADGTLDAAARQIIVDYLNLCAEEYLWFSEGYIHHDTWRSWCAGMLWYFDRDPIRTVWDEENATNSYYGLSLEVIRRGAG